jgi:hypothetical protein
MENLTSYASFSLEHILPLGLEASGGLTGAQRPFRQRCMNVLFAEPTRSASASAAPEIFLGNEPLLSARRLIESRMMSLTGTQVRALLRQVGALLADAEELRLDGIRPSMASFSGLLSYLAKSQGLVHPNLSMSPTGLFSGSWSPGRRAKLTLTFADGHTAEWTGVDLNSDPPASGSGAFKVMDGDQMIPAPFANWMRS